MIARIPARALAGVVAWAAALAAPARGQDQPFFMGLGGVEPDARSSARAVAPDGSAVVGSADIGGGLLNSVAYRWTASTGMVSLGGLGPGVSAAHGVSAHGAVVVGNAVHLAGNEAFIWTEQAGMVGLGDLPGGDYLSTSWGTSWDGRVVVGFSMTDNAGRAFRWTAGTGLVALPALPDGSIPRQGRGTTADGAFVVGEASVPSPVQAFRWSEATGSVGLGDMPGGSPRSYAFGVSADGSVVVGQGGSEKGREAFRWTASTGMIGLGDLPGSTYQSAANAVSADGAVVVGNSIAERDGRAVSAAFIWTERDGMRALEDVLRGDLGLDLGEWRLTSALGVSADGRTVVGDGYPGPFGSGVQSQAWIAYLGPGCRADLNHDGAVDAVDVQMFRDRFLSGSVLADLDYDLRLTVRDFVEFRRAWLQDCP